MLLYSGANPPCINRTRRTLNMHIWMLRNRYTCSVCTTLTYAVRRARQVMARRIEILLVRDDIRMIILYGNVLVTRFSLTHYKPWYDTKHNIWFMILITASSFISQSTIGGGCDFPDVQFRFSQSPIWYCRSSPVICGPSLGKSATKTKPYRMKK